MDVEVDTYLDEKKYEKLNQGLGFDEPIKFSSHGRDGSIKGEGDTISDSNIFRENSIDEFPETKQIHYFYFVKFRFYEDPMLKAKIDQADKEVHERNRARVQIREAIKLKKVERAEVISKLKLLIRKDKRYRKILDEKRKTIEPLQQALGKLRIACNLNRERGVGLCSSEEELNYHIYSLHYRMQHECNTLVEEKQLLREIEELEGTREKVVANAAMKAEIQDSFGWQEVIQDQVTHIGVDLDGIRKEKHAVTTKIKFWEEERKAIEEEISSLQEELVVLNNNQGNAYEVLVELRKQHDQGNACYYQNRSILSNARELAAKKDVGALEELSHKEVEKFMCQWNSSKVFRDDYEKRILLLLDSQQLSRDGQVRNPNEKPLVSEASMEIETERVATSPLPLHKSIPILKVQIEDNKNLTELESTAKGEDQEDKKTISSETNGIDVVKLREMKREDEVAKAKLVLERKKKLAAKAAVQVKEAEKKLKNLKKGQTKSKAAPNANPGAQAAEADTEVFELENADEKIESPIPSKNKEHNVNTLRRRNRSKGQDQHPKT